MKAVEKISSSYPQELSKKIISILIFSTCAYICANIGAKEMVKQDIKNYHKLEKSYNDAKLSELHLAVIYARVKELDYLILRGENINARDNKGRTPLYMSVQGFITNINILSPFGSSSNSGNYLSMITKLIEKGADINIPDNKGNTPLFLAAKHHKFGLVKLLIKQGAKVDESMLSNTIYNQPEIIESIKAALYK